MPPRPPMIAEGSRKPPKRTSPGVTASGDTHGKHTGRENGCGCGAGFVESLESVARSLIQPEANGHPHGFLDRVQLSASKVQIRWRQL
ncbi:MazG family protein [Anopheles sinensis]|uniref:MazG family protein n=1 Tax=Anopheles sinensis TaxID=74873 RepID=A0A084WP28_ANOSI|nr:MazG family protein [Anopheles sinensis]